MLVSEDWDAVYNGYGKVSFPSAPKPVTVVEAIGPVPDSYGSTDEGEISVVFSLDGKYYRKSGYTTSYDGNTWDGPCVEVEPVTQTVTVYKVAR